MLDARDDIFLKDEDDKDTFATMTDEPDFDIYDNDAFNDKTFADLLNGLKEAESNMSFIFTTLTSKVQEMMRQVLLRPKCTIMNTNSHVKRYRSWMAVSSRHLYLPSTVSEVREEYFRYCPPIQSFNVQVTDLVCLDWCEIKFHYTLEGGKKRKNDGILTSFYY